MAAPPTGGAAEGEGPRCSGAAHLKGDALRTAYKNAYERYAAETQERQRAGALAGQLQRPLHTAQMAAATGSGGIALMYTSWRHSLQVRGHFAGLEPDQAAATHRPRPRAQSIRSRVDGMRAPNAGKGRRAFDSGPFGSVRYGLVTSGIADAPSESHRAGVVSVCASR